MRKKRLTSSAATDSTSTLSRLSCTVSSARPVWPARLTRTPPRPAASCSAGMTSRRAPMSSMACALNGSESSTTSIRAVDPSSVMKACGSSPRLLDAVGRQLLARADGARDAGLLLDQRLQQRDLVGRARAGALALHEDLGRRDDAGREAGRGVVGGLPRAGVLRQALDQGEAEPHVVGLVGQRAEAGDAQRAPRRPRASRRSPRERIRARAARDRRPSSGSGAAPVAAARRAPHDAPRKRCPQIASSAGTSVSATSVPTSAVTAMPGPSARKKPSEPSTSVPVPAATISPAVTTIGTMRIARAVRRLAPLLAHVRRRRISVRKKTQ